MNCVKCSEKIYDKISVYDFKEKDYVKYLICSKCVESVATYKGYYCDINYSYFIDTEYYKNELIDFLKNSETCKCLKAIHQTQFLDEDFENLLVKLFNFIK